jgi:hypothetical protein
MDISGVILAVSLVAALSNGIGMGVMYLKYVKTMKNLILSVRVNEHGDVEISDDILHVSPVKKR